MAAKLLFTDSFDAYNHVSFTNGKWTNFDGSYGGKAVTRTDTGVVMVFYCSNTLSVSGLDNMTVGAFRQSATLSDGQGQLIVGLPNASNYCASVRFNPDGTCSAYDSTGAVKATSTKVVSALGRGRYVELGVKCSTTVGQIIVRVDGEEVINVGSCNTLAYTKGFALGGTGGGYNTSYDDLYVSWDTAGGISFMSDVEVRAIFPDAAGTYSQFTPIGTGVNYQNVDEKPISTTDYNESNTVGQIDSFNFPDLVLTGTVWGIEFCVYAAKDNTEIRAIRGTCRIGGVDYLSPNTEYLSTDPQYFWFMWAYNPATSAYWTLAQANSAEFGYKVEV